MIDQIAIKEMRKKVTDFSRGFFEGHFIIPTAFRKSGQNTESKAYKNGAIFPIGGHLGFGIYPIIGYVCLYSECPKTTTALLITQITTNLADGVYEWYRYESKKIKSSPGVIDNSPENSKNKPSKLENIQPDHTSAFIDPWKVEIPEVGDKK